MFLGSGDSLEVEPNRAPIVTAWFEHMFASKSNLEFYTDGGSMGGSGSVDTDSKIKKLNISVKNMNQLLASSIPDNVDFFKYSDDLDQPWLNDIHKKWVMLNDKYPGIILGHDSCFPQEWHDVNNCVHDIEYGYQAFFINNKLPILPTELHTKIKAEDCQYSQIDLMLSYCNLGRHQYQQWLTGSDTDDETNNYKSIRYEFTYNCFLDIVDQPISPSVNYVNWCRRQGLEVLPPWISIGKFLKYDRFEVRKLFHRNLLTNGKVGFYYE